MRFFLSIFIPLATGFISLSSLGVKASDINAILSEIEKLEAKSDPKCYATASRLEDFMFGTPLTDKARFDKNRMQQHWLLEIWQKADKLAKQNDLEAIDRPMLQQAMNQSLSFAKNASGHWQLNLPDNKKVQIHKDDKRQYGSIAYSLRALLALQQQSLMDLDNDRLPLDQGAMDYLVDALDLYTLAVLKVADTQARQTNQHQLDHKLLANVWSGLGGSKTASTATPVKQPKRPAKPIELALLKSIINQKVRSYAQYNELNNQLFVRNLQVYFARNRWPADSQVAKQFRQYFTETVIAFSADLFSGAQQLALQNGHNVITADDVGQFVQTFIPHRINQYEDAIFFPKLAKSEQVTIESYDMDAFRDSGIHWRYLQFAVFDPNFKAFLEPDPFAAELLAENIAQFGVLLLRIVGDEGRLSGDKRISLKHFESAVNAIQARINRHKNIKDSDQQTQVLASSPINKTVEGQLFDDVTKQSGIDLMHRSSDWLSRLLRSYLKISDTEGTITIPPAFGGAGIAAADINNDNLTDLLILSGRGNKLYMNRGNGRFEDITQSAGLDWRRAQDKQPGEPRQPIIADLDNDGRQDIVITYVNDQHRVYRNLGGEKFEDMTLTSALGGKDLVGGPATIFDYDNDGLLDIYISYFGNYLKGVLPSLKRRNTNGLPNQLFRNKGNFQFENVTQTAGVGNRGWGQAAVHSDFNNDGLQDLIVGNDFGVNGYYKNLGNGRFKDVSGEMGTDKPSYTMGIGSADLNDDLLPDFYISNIVTMNKDEKYVLPDADTPMKFNPEKLAKMRVIEANDLFISRREPDQKIPQYNLSEAIGRGYSSTGWSWDADFFDYDNDGDDDLYVLNGMNEFNVYGSENKYYTEPLNNQKVNVYIPVSTKESNVFFRNQDGKLNNISAKSGVDLLGNSRSAVYLDLEGDGDLDMVLNNYHEKAVVYRNNSEKLGHNWLKVKLKGAPASKVNLDAIGARIIVTTEGGEQRWREVQGTTGYMSVHPKEQHFGLANHQKANVEVRWPNGTISKIEGVKANQTLLVEYSTTSAATSGSGLQ